MSFHVQVASLHNDFGGGPRQDKQEQQEQESQKRKEEDKLAQNHRQ